MLKAKVANKGAHCSPTSHLQPRARVKRVKPKRNAVSEVEETKEATAKQQHESKSKSPAESLEPLPEFTWQHRPLVFEMTPWDLLSHEDLVREAQRAHMALLLARKALSSKAADDQETALLAINDSLRRITQKYDETDLYMRFFRYATPLLLPSITSVPGHHPWYMCTSCNMPVRGTDPLERKDKDSPCPQGQRYCTGILRKLDWRDLKRKQDVTTGRSQKSEPVDVQKLLEELQIKLEDKDSQKASAEVDPAKT